MIADVLNPSELNEDRLWMMAQGHATFQMLWSATDLGLFDLLNDSDRSLEEIADDLSLSTYSLEILMCGLCSLGLVVKDESGKYRNSPISSEKLVSSSSENIIDLLAWQNHICYPGLANFKEALQKSTNVGLENIPGDNKATLYDKISQSPKLESVFQNAMSNLTNLIHPSLIATKCFSDTKHLLDVGGGAGTNAIRLVKNYPDLKVTILDNETVCERAIENVKAHALEGSIDTCVGNIFEKFNPPDSIDSIIFNHMFTIFSPEENQQILKIAYDILPKNGKVYVLNMVTNNDETGPLSTALASAYFLGIATGKGKLYPASKYQNWFETANFKNFHQNSNLPFHHSLFVGKK